MADFTRELSKAVKIVVKGWKKSGIVGQFDGSTVLPLEGFFLDVILMTIV